MVADSLEEMEEFRLSVSKFAIVFLGGLGVLLMVLAAVTAIDTLKGPPVYKYENDSYLNKYPFVTPDQEIRRIMEEYESRQAALREQVAREKRITDYVLLVVLGGVFIFGFGVVISVVRTGIKLKGGIVHVSYPAFAFRQRSVEIPLDSISKLMINRVTPFGPDNRNEFDISWRDRLIINDRVVLPGWIFGNLGELVEKIKQFNPAVEITFYKNTLADNL